jgi:hypothetical protein
VSDACHFEVSFLRFRQETLFQLLHVVFITPYKRKNSAAFQKKMKIFASLRTTDYGDFTDWVRAPTTKGRSEPNGVA